MDIEIKIPYDDTGDLGASYNRCMEVSKDWVLFLDHDVFLLNPNWYLACKSVIESVGYSAGLITCYTNRIGNPNQRIDDFLSLRLGDDIKKHTDQAKSMYSIYEHSVTDITEVSKQWKISGFFMLTHKKAWLAAGKFASGFLGVDNIYGDSIINAGYRIYRMEGLYCYHRYWRDWRMPKCI